MGFANWDIVALCSLNSDSYLEWLLAVAFVGGIAAPLNYRWSLKEARVAMEVVKPVMLVTDESSNYWYSKLQIDRIPFLKWHTFMNSPSDYSSKRFVLTTGMPKKPAFTSLSLDYFHPPDGTAIICFTSGIAGKPKGVAISHSTLIVQSLAKLAIVGYNEDDVYLHTTPLCHIGGISSAMAMLLAGGCHVFLPKFEAKSVIEAIDQLHVTAFITVPAIMADIISLIRMEGILKGKENVKKILNGAGSLSAELIKDVSIFFPRAKLISAHGMTETCSSLTFLTLHDPESGNSIQPFHTSLLSSTQPSFFPTNSAGDIKFSHPGNQLGAVCVGKPASHVELKISLEDSSHVGRILTRGPHVMLGYWGQSPKIPSNASVEGWLDTGDIGQFDDFGNLWLIGRSKDRIKSGGLTVYPEEVEAVLSQHPGVSRIVVVGLPDPRLTEMVAACVKLNENWKWDDSFSNQFTQSNNQTLSAEILRQFCKEKDLSGFKIPTRFILWRKQFPLTSTGKLRRDEVRREAMSYAHLLPSRLKPSKFPFLRKLMLLIYASIRGESSRL